MQMTDSDYTVNDWRQRRWPLLVSRRAVRNSAGSGALHDLVYLGLLPMRCLNVCTMDKLEVDCEVPGNRSWLLSVLYHSSLKYFQTVLQHFCASTSFKVYGQLCQFTSFSTAKHSLANIIIVTAQRCANVVHLCAIIVMCLSITRTRWYYIEMTIDR